MVVSVWHLVGSAAFDVVNAWLLKDLKTHTNNNKNKSRNRNRVISKNDINKMIIGEQWKRFAAIIQRNK